MHDYISNAGKLGAGAKKGHNIVHNVTRERVATISVTPQELEIMSAQGEYFKVGRYAEVSKVQFEMPWTHWRSFCLRFKGPL